MKLPRDESGLSLAKRLEKLGYSITRQTSSHIRLTTSEKGEHHVTIPAHKNLKIGTLNSILVDVAGHFKITKEELIAKLW
ncbi:MAG: hypothetical protein A2W19_03920 [Spirochaetes bacterium RBG_16_49_21]|nr:MAG: hypothetical protein A2W19_03920 [Spirochaetes bacterium RBG_16_49_21]